MANQKEAVRTKVVSSECATCGKKIEFWQSSKRKFCSSACSAANVENKKKRVAALRANGRSPKLYSRCNSQWVEVGGKRAYCRSSWEANYARYLEWMKVRNEISDWLHEPETFWFEKIRRGVRSYLPDFKVVLTDGTIEWHEVKGWMDAKSKTKLRRMKKYYPSETVIVRDQKWFKANSPILSQLVDGWEKKRKSTP